MNTLKIKLNPYKDTNIASMDDRPLSPYSELTNFLKEPFLKWAHQLLDATERELNDDFRLVVAGEAFEKAFLRDMQSIFEGCVSFEEEKFQIANTVDERLQMVKGLAEKYWVTYNASQYRMPIYSDEVIAVNEEIMTMVSMSNASIYVTSDKNVVNNNIGGNGSKIFILKSDVNRITHVSDMQYVWEVNEERVNDVLQMIVDRFVKIPLIIDIVNNLNAKRSDMDKADADLLSLATEIDMFVTVDEIPDLEVGCEYVPVLKTVPAGNAIPQIRIQSLNPAVVSINDGKLLAQSGGKTIIEFYKADEIIPFTKQEVVAFKNNNAQKIALSVTEKTMAIGKSQNIIFSVIPEDAEDANNIKWSVNDETIATVDSTGCVTTRNSGVVIVTAQATRVNATIEIEVAQNITEISLSSNKVELFVGETQEIEVSYLPKNVYDAEVEWKTNDKDVAVVESTENGTSVIRATGIGTCQLTCVAKEGGCKAVCNVLVESTFKKRENMHSMLSLSFVALIVAILSAFFALPIGIYAGAIAAIACGVIAIIKNKKDIIWAIVIIIIAASMIMS